MTYEHLFLTLSFAFATVITPGPNNLMLMASGANFGLRRSLPHMLGVGLGFPMMVVLVGVGVMQVFDLWPASFIILQIFSFGYLLYLAWKIANASAPSGGQSPGKRAGTPLTFLQAASFQWVNPKAWGMAVSAITTYAASREINAVLFVAGCYVACGVVSTSSWTLLGQEMQRVLTNPLRLRVFNYSMAALLVGTMLWVTLSQG
jgi:threonine/homoserine/homoserine lactone efflux protein